jgi:hypothetical protein
MKVQIKEAVGITEANQDINEAYTVAGVVAGVSFQLSGIDATGWTAYISGGTVQQVANTVTGLDHLEGETVCVFTNAGNHPDEVVSSGSITLDYYANVITAGLPYTYTVQPMKLEPGMQGGTSRGKSKRIPNMSVAFYESYGAKWGPDEDNLSAVPFGTGIQPALFTGDKETDFDMDYETGASAVIQGQSPFPMTILSIAPSMVTE